MDKYGYQLSKLFMFLKLHNMLITCSVIGFFFCKWTNSTFNLHQLPAQVTVVNYCQALNMLRLFWWSLYVLHWGSFYINHNLFVKHLIPAGSYNIIMSRSSKIFNPRTIHTPLSKLHLYRKYRQHTHRPTTVCPTTWVHKNRIYTAENSQWKKSCILSNLQITDADFVKFACKYVKSKYLHKQFDTWGISVAGLFVTLLVSAWLSKWHLFGGLL